MKKMFSHTRFFGILETWNRMKYVDTFLFCFRLWQRDILTRFFAPSFFINRLILVPLEMSCGRFKFVVFSSIVIGLLKRLPGAMETGELLFQKSNNSLKKWKQLFCPAGLHSVPFEFMRIFMLPLGCRTYMAYFSQGKNKSYKSCW